MLPLALPLACLRSLRSGLFRRAKPLHIVRKLPMANEHLAELARERAERYPPRTPERRAAAALDFADKTTRADATALLRQLEQEAHQEA
jgi:hypothetical protein